MSDDERIDPDEYRDVLLPVIERWFPEDDAPYNRIDELLSAARVAGFEPGVKEWAMDWWIARFVDAEAERDRLRGAIGRHHYDIAHVAAKGLGVRAADRALYEETGFPDVGESDRETAAAFVARMEKIEAERDRLRTVVDVAVAALEGVAHTTTEVPIEETARAGLAAVSERLHPAQLDVSEEGT